MNAIISSMKVSEIKNLLSNGGIKYTPKMKKAELVQLLVDSQPEGFRFFPVNYFPEEYPVEEVENMTLLRFRNLLDDKKDIKFLVSVEKQIEWFFVMRYSTRESWEERMNNMMQINTVKQVGEFLLENEMEKQLKELSHLFQVILFKEAERRL
jgi:hypothetical protein